MMDEGLFNEKTLHWLKLRDMQMVPTDVLPGVHYESHMEIDRFFKNQMRDMLIYEINARVLGENLPSFIETKSEIFHTPKNPWQHFKEVYADKWFMRAVVKKWPVKFNRQKVTLTAEWDQWAIYPWIKNLPITPGWEPVRMIMPANTTVRTEKIEDES